MWLIVQSNCTNGKSWNIWAESQAWGLSTIIGKEAGGSQGYSACSEFMGRQPYTKASMRQSLTALGSGRREESANGNHCQWTG